MVGVVLGVAPFVSIGLFGERGVTEERFEGVYVAVDDHGGVDGRCAIGEQ